MTAATLLAVDRGPAHQRFGHAELALQRLRELGELQLAGRRHDDRLRLLRHQGQFSTLYGHMSRFEPSVTKGTRVSQGQIIGHVGQTGWATGPHVHYEFRVAYVPVNPLTIALPQAFPLEGKHLAAFKARSGPLMDRIGLLRDTRQYAALD